MHSESARGPAPGAEEPRLSRTGGTIFLFGPAGQTAPIAELLGAEGYACRAFEDRDGFLDATFEDPPNVAIVWGEPDGLAFQDLPDILRHHLSRNDCAWCSQPPGEAGRETESAGAPFTILRLPIRPDELLARLRELRVSEGEARTAIPRVLVVDDDQNIVLLGLPHRLGAGHDPARGLRRAPGGGEGP